MNTVEIKYLEVGELLFAIPEIEDKGVNVVLYHRHNTLWEKVELPQDLTRKLNVITAGDVLEITKKFNIEDESLGLKKINKIITPDHWIKAADWKRNGVKMDLNLGQSILIYASPGAGKTTTLKELDKSFKPNVDSTRMLLFGERRDDANEGWMVIDSSLPTEVQKNMLMEEVAEALYKAHTGEDTVLGIDSLTRIVELLTSLHRKTHMVSGGISSCVKNWVSRIIKLGGMYSNSRGSLTFIGTALTSKDNNTWKAILTEFKSSSNAEICPQLADLSFNRKTSGIQEFRIFGKRMYIG